MGGELASFSILHFATHGLLNDRHPALSGLVFSLVDATGRPRDGFLRVHEIPSLRLDAELVVLSACRTALGRDVRGEGLVGLAQGFFATGASQVIVSAWNVNDQATAELMVRFYRGLLEDGLSASQALREAQRSMLEEERWRAPYFWAAFMLQGDWR
ncbi:MAG: CHAT domain-containing protein [bacterium]|nr:CHAT domain-containing protein [bacterium]